MPEIQDPPYKVNPQVLADFSATVQAKPNLSREELFKKFPEFNNDEKFLQSALDYSSTSLSGKYKSVEELNSKFPEFDFNFEKKNGVGSNGAPKPSNGSAPSTSQSPEGIDVKAEAQKFEQARTGSGGILNTINEFAKGVAQAGEIPKPSGKPIDPKMAAKYPVVRNYRGNEVRFKTEDEADFYEKNNGITRPAPNVPKEAHPFNFDRFTPQELPKSPQPTKSKVPKTHPFHFDRFIDQSVVPMATSLEEAHSNDKNVTGNLWNKFLGGIESMVAGSADQVFTLMNKVLPESVVGGTSDEVTKMYRDEVIPQMQGSITNRIGANVTEEEKAAFEENFWTSSVGGLFSSLPAIVQPKGMKMAALLAQAYDGSIKSINSTKNGKDLSEDTKTGFGLTVGIAQAAWEKYGLDKIFGKMSTKAAMSLATKTLTDLIKRSEGKAITAEAFEQALGVAAKTLKRKILDAGGKVGKAGTVEFVTGTMQELSTVSLEEFTNVATGKQIFDKTSFVDKAKRILYSGAQEAVGGGILGTASIPFKTTRNYIAEKVAAAETPADIDKLKDELMSISVKENMTPEETTALAETIDNYVRVNAKVPPSADNKKEALENIVERENIYQDIINKEKELAVIDEAFKPELRKEIAVLKSVVEEINKEINGVPVYKIDGQEVSREEMVEYLDNPKRKKSVEVVRDPELQDRLEKEGEDVVTETLTDAEKKIKSGDLLSALTSEEKKEWNDLSMAEKLELAKENLPEVSDLSDLDIVKVADTRAKELLAARNLPEPRTEDEVLSIIKEPVPKGNLKNAEVQVKYTNPKTNEVTLKPRKAGEAIDDLKRQVGIIDAIKKCL